jgi:hypothetical protein
MNGSKVIVGNHEDWFDQDSALRIIPAENGEYGSVIFTFESEGWAQGGMNSEGLFFDGAQTPLVNGLNLPHHFSFADLTVYALEFCFILNSQS